MTYRARVSALFLTFLFVAPHLLWAQIDVQTQRLRTMAQEAASQWEREREEVRAFADRTGIPLRLEFEDGQVAVLERIENGQPVYVATTNLGAAQTSSVDRLWPGGGLGLSLTGSTQTLSIWEVGGTVRASHQEFGDRVVVKDEDDPSSHATHVGGTMVAAGVEKEAQGMAFEGTLHSYDSQNALSEMAGAAADGLQVSNHSYGLVVGWGSCPTEGIRWRWYGDPEISETEDWRFGFYGQSAAKWDEMVQQAPHYLITHSAGNDRIDGPPSAFQSLEHEVWDPDSSDWVVSDKERDLDGGEDGYQSIPPRSTAKNTLTVGAVEGTGGEHDAPEDVEMSSFSGWGPTDDGRIKPDLVSKGVDVYSPTAASDTDYRFFSGTSMSSPVASGSVALLQEHYEQFHGERPLASTIRALLLHTADEAGREGPDYKYGWGLLNAGRAAEVLSNDADGGQGVHVQEIVLEEGETFEYEIQSRGEGPLVATIAWTDPPGEVPEPQLDPDGQVLVNDLDLRVEGPDGEHDPFVLDPSDPKTLATAGDNDRDNVEQVHIESPGRERYTVSISHKGSLEGEEQSVSLITTGHVVPDIPVISLEPSSRELQFGEVLVGESRTDTFSVRNVGEGQLEGEVGFAQASDPLAIQEGEGPYELAPAEKMEVIVAYAPDSSSRREREIELSHNGPAQESPRRVPLSGAGRAIIAEPDTTDLGEVALGESSTETFLLKNEGPSTIEGEIRLVEDSRPFSLAEEVVSYNLDSGESREVQVTYTPQTIGVEHSGIARVEDNLEDPVRVILRGKPLGSFAGGSGTEEDPYQVANVNQLQLVNRYAFELDTHFIQVSDIDASETAEWNDGAGFNPIGREFDPSDDKPSRPFRGTYDGGGHAITGLTIDRPDERGAGVFDLVEGTIKNVRLRNAEINADVEVGALVGESSGGTIEDVRVSASVSGWNRIGGLVGANSRGKILRSRAEGTAKGRRQDVGGIAGYNSGTIRATHAAVDVRGRTGVGGVAGRNDSGGEVRLSRATGDVTCFAVGGCSSGGVVGNIASLGEGVHKSYATGRVEGTTTGGVAGWDERSSASIATSYWDREATGQQVNSSSGNPVNGLSTSEMTGEDALSNMTAFDFTNEQTWLLVEGDYPALWWEDVEAMELPDRPFVAIESRSVNFGFASVNDRSSATIPIENTGQKTLEGEVELTEGSSFFSTEEDTDEFAVAPGDTLRLTVGYAPDAFTGHEGTLEIRHNAANEESPVEADLSGVGTTGAGTKEAPYEVAVLEHLHHLDVEPGAHFSQSKDIDAGSTKDYNDGAGFKPIGSEEEPFVGSYDGGGHVISDLTIDRPRSDRVGLFGQVGEEGRLLDITLKDVEVVGDFATGGVAGRNRGRVEGVHVTGRVLADDNSIGGAVGYNRGMVVKADTDVRVSGRKVVGGIVGRNRPKPEGEVAVRESRAVGKVTGEKNGVGGLIGLNQAEVTDAYAEAVVEGTEHVGGLIGENTGTAARTFAAGTVTGDAKVGGLIGTNEDSVSASYWDVEAMGQNTGIAEGSREGATGLPTAEMTGEDPFWNMAFDFADDQTWLLVEGDYPALWWEDVETMEVPGGGAVAIQTGSVSFGFASLNDRSSATIPIENTGQKTLEGEVELTEGSSFFSLEENPGEFDVPPGDTLALTVVYGPDGFARHEGTLQVRHTAANEESPVEVDLSGIATTGAGTEEDPYEVAVLDHLRHLDVEPGAHFAQSSDIDAGPTKDWNEGAGFEPVGSQEDPFNESYDGGGHVISDLTINRPEIGRVGLFRQVGEEGHIFDVTLKDVDVVGRYITGGVVGKNSGQVEGVHVTGLIRSNHSTVGGIVGFNGGIIEETNADVRVWGEDRVGGIVGHSSRGGAVRESRAEGKVTGEKNRVGGLIGWNQVEVKDAYSEAVVEGTEQVGGLIGENAGIAGRTGTVARSFATGTVTGDAKVGGLIGTNEDNVSASYWDAEATGQNTGIAEGSQEGATGLSTAEMTGEDAQENMSALDFGEVWQVGAGYPVLWWEPAPVAFARAAIDDEGRHDFGDTGVEIRFFDLSGSGRVTVRRYAEAPSNASGIGKENTSSYRFVIQSEPGLTPGSPEVLFDVETLDGIEDPEAVQVYRRPTEGVGTFETVPTSYDGSEDELVAQTEDFSEFVFASDSEPLPVELAGFEGISTEGKVRLTWQTASEEKNAGFEVQRRSTNQPKTAWAKVGFVESKAEGGTTDESKKYQFTDKKLPYADRLQYRLRQMDLDGSTELTDPVEVERTVDELELRKTFPNPAHGQITVQFAVPDRDDISLRLYDVLGRQVRTVQQSKVEGRQELQVDLSELPSGAYFLRLSAENATKTQRLTVVR